jgi:hypothetical protein
MPRSSARFKRSDGWRPSGRSERREAHRRQLAVGRVFVTPLGKAARVSVFGMPQRSWLSGTPRRRLHKPLPYSCLGAQHRVSSIERVRKFSGGRFRRVADGVGSGLLKAASVARPRRLAFWPDAGRLARGRAPLPTGAVRDPQLLCAANDSLRSDRSDRSRRNTAAASGERQDQPFDAFGWLTADAAGATDGCAGFDPGGAACCGAPDVPAAGSTGARPGNIA